MREFWNLMHFEFLSFFLEFHTRHLDFWGFSNQISSFWGNSILIENTANFSCSSSLQLKQSWEMLFKFIWWAEFSDYLHFVIAALIVASQAEIAHEFRFSKFRSTNFISLKGHHNLLSEDLEKIFLHFSNMLNSAVSFVYSWNCWFWRYRWNAQNFISRFNNFYI